MKTAVQNIVEKLKELRDSHPVSGNLQQRISRGKYVFAIQIAEKELETEKQQIIDAYNKGNRSEFYDSSEESGEQYYNETFEQQ